MARHERDVKLKRITRIFIYFILILVIILLFLFVRRWEENQTPKGKQSTVQVSNSSPDIP
jgi:F0F1-type ATP synthase membrane subunit a